MCQLIRYVLRPQTLVTQSLRRRLCPVPISPLSSALQTPTVAQHSEVLLLAVIGHFFKHAIQIY